MISIFQIDWFEIVGEQSKAIFFFFFLKDNIIMLMIRPRLGGSTSPQKFSKMQV